MVQVPLIVDKDSGVNDYLDRDGSRTPIDFPCGLGLEKRIEAQVVQAATKWKRMALKTSSTARPGEGICTDMRAVRKDYFLDHDHSSYVDQWDWERVITAKDAQPRTSSRTSSARSGRSSAAPRSVAHGHVPRSSRTSTRTSPRS